MIIGFLRHTAIREETFGRLTLNDPNLVDKLRRGLVMDDQSQVRVMAFMQRYEDSKS
jgi:hypothetical protein